MLDQTTFNENLRNRKDKFKNTMYGHKIFAALILGILLTVSILIAVPVNVPFNSHLEINSQNPFNDFEPRHGFQGENNLTLINGSITLNQTLYATNLLITNGSILNSNGFSIIVSGCLRNDGTIFSGYNVNSSVNLTQSVGGSGGGGLALSQTYPSYAENGYSTIVSGGGSQVIDVNNNVVNKGYPGNSTGPEAISLLTIKNFYSSGIQKYITGVAGGCAESGGSVFAKGGDGGYGLFIEASSIIAGNINTAGQNGAGSGTGSGVGLAAGGGGGGGSVIILYSQNLVNGTYYINGGGSTCVSGLSGYPTIIGGEGGSGEVIIDQYSGLPPIPIVLGINANPASSLNNYGNVTYTYSIYNHSLSSGSNNVGPAELTYREAFDPETGNLFISSYNGVYVFSTGRKVITQNIDTGQTVYCVFFDIYNSYIYASNYNNGSISVFNGYGSLVNTIHTGGNPLGLSASPNGYLFAANFVRSINSNTPAVFEINTIDNAVSDIYLSSYYSPAYSVSYDLNNSYLYIITLPHISTTTNSSKMYIYSPEHNSIVEEISLSCPATFSLYDPFNQMVMVNDNGISFYSSNSTPGLVVSYLFGVSCTFSSFGINSNNGSIYYSDGQVLYQLTGLNSYYNVSHGSYSYASFHSKSRLLSNAIFDEYTLNVYSFGQNDSTVFFLNTKLQQSFSKNIFQNSSFLSVSSENSAILFGGSFSRLRGLIPTDCYNLVISHNLSLNSNIYAHNLTILPNVTLTTDGYNIFVECSFINLGSIRTGFGVGLFSLNESLGGSGGGGGYPPGSSVSGSRGYSTLASGGSSGSPGADGQSTVISGPIAVNASAISSWCNSQSIYSMPNGISEHISGVAGGFSSNYLSQGASFPGYGAFGIYIQANKILPGKIIASGQPSVGVSPGSGGGGGGVILLAYREMMGNPVVNVTGGSGQTQGITYDQDYGGNGGNGRLICINLSGDSFPVNLPLYTNMILPSLNLTSYNATFSGNGNYIFISHDNLLEILNSKNETYMGSLTVGNKIALVYPIDESNSTIILTRNGSEGQIIELNNLSIAHETLIDSIPLSVAYDPENLNYYLTTSNGSIDDFLTNLSIVSSTPTNIDHPDIIFDQYTNTLYSTDNYSIANNTSMHSVTEYSPSDLSSIANISLKYSPELIQFDPFNAALYVLSSNSSNITVIGADNIPAKTIHVGTDPTAISYIPESNSIAVLNAGSETISIISPVLLSKQNWSYSEFNEVSSNPSISTQISNNANQITLINAISNTAILNYSGFSSFGIYNNLISSYAAGVLEGPVNETITISTEGGFNSFIKESLVKLTSNLSPYIVSYQKDDIFESSASVTMNFHALSKNEMLVALIDAIPYNDQTGFLRNITGPQINGVNPMQIDNSTCLFSRSVHANTSSLSNVFLYPISQAGNYYMNDTLSCPNGNLVIYGFLMNTSSLYNIKFVSNSTSSLNFAVDIDNITTFSNHDLVSIFEPNGTYFYSAFVPLNSIPESSASASGSVTPQLLTSDPNSSYEIYDGHIVVKGSYQSIYLQSFASSKASSHGSVYTDIIGFFSYLASFLFLIFVYSKFSLYGIFKSYTYLFIIFGICLISESFVFRRRLPIIFLYLGISLVILAAAIFFVFNLSYYDFMILGALLILSSLVYLRIGDIASISLGSAVSVLSIIQLTIDGTLHLSIFYQIGNLFDSAFSAVYNYILGGLIFLSPDVNYILFSTVLALIALNFVNVTPGLKRVKDVLQPSTFIDENELFSYILCSIGSVLSVVGIYKLYSAGEIFHSANFTFTLENYLFFFFVLAIVYFLLQFRSLRRFNDFMRRAFGSFFGLNLIRKIRDYNFVPEQEKFLKLSIGLMRYESVIYEKAIAMYSSSGETGKAIKLANAGAQRFKTDPTFNVIQSELLQKTGNLKSAIDELNKAKGKNFSDSIYTIDEVNWRLSNLYIENDNFELAKPILSDLVMNARDGAMRKKASQLLANPRPAKTATKESEKTNRLIKENKPLYEETVKPSEKLKKIDLSSVDVGILGISSAGKTSLVAILGIFLSEKGRETGINFKFFGDVKRLTYYRNTILNGEFPESTNRNSRDVYGLNIKRTSEKRYKSCVIVDSPGDDLFNEKILDYLGDPEKFSDYLRSINFSYLLTCKKLMVVIPAKPFMSNGHDRNFIDNYSRVLTELLDARKIVNERHSSKIASKIGIKKADKVSIVITQWDEIVNQTDLNISPSQFVNTYLHGITNVVTLVDSQEEQEEKSKDTYYPPARLICLGIQSKKEVLDINGQKVERSYPIIGENNFPSYINYDKLISWLLDD